MTTPATEKTKKPPPRNRDDGFSLRKKRMKGTSFSFQRPVMKGTLLRRVSSEQGAAHKGCEHPAEYAESGNHIALPPF